MALKNYQYKDASIEYDDEIHSLSINGKPVKVNFVNDKYLLDELPYQYYGSLKTIAEAIVDSSPNY